MAEDTQAYSHEAAPAAAGADRPPDDLEHHLPSTDGRLVRGERTRHVIVDAMIDLIEGGDPHPTARRISEHAGVSLRLVFHHYADVEDLFHAAMQRQFERHWNVVRDVSPQKPLHRRIESLCQQRSQLFSAVAPVRQAAYSRIHASPELRRTLLKARNELREQLASAFAPELSQAGQNAPLLLDAIEMVTSWDAWHALRVHAGRSATTCRRVLALLLTTLLTETSALS